MSEIKATENFYNYGIAMSLGCLAYPQPPQWRELIAGSTCWQLLAMDTEAYECHNYWGGGGGGAELLGF